MRFADRESRVHQIIHPAAALKHMPADQVRSVGSWSESQCSTRRLIEQASRSQSHKWRKYATSEEGGPDRTPRSDIS